LQHEAEPESIALVGGLAAVASREQTEPVGRHRRREQMRNMAASAVIECRLEKVWAFIRDAIEARADAIAQELESVAVKAS